MFSAPVAVVSQNLSQMDAAEIYVVIGKPHSLEPLLAHSEVKEIAPFRAPVALMVQIPSAIHTRLVELDYWVIPASRLATICGILEL